MNCECTQAVINAEVFTESFSEEYWLGNHTQLSRAHYIICTVRDCVRKNVLEKRENTASLLGFFYWLRSDKSEAAVLT